MGSENFDLSIALALLPVMNDEECVTRTLINGIDFYSSLLCDSAKKILTNFVLKTRLSQVGKFYLNSEYNDVNEMIYDMKKQLLPRKSHPLLQIKMFKCKQGYKSIKEFGEEIDQLLVDLTIAQLDFLGNSEEENKKIIFPINEKTAIKCFCDGLSNDRIRLILACRQPNSLLQAIQVAIEEEMMIESDKSRHDGRYFNKNMKLYSEHRYRDRNQIIKRKNNYQFRNKYGQRLCIKQNKICEDKNYNELKNQHVCHDASAKLQIQQVQRYETPEIVPSNNDSVTHSLVHKNNIQTNKVMKLKKNRSNGRKIVDEMKNEFPRVFDKRENKSKHEDEHEAEECNLEKLFSGNEIKSNSEDKKCDISIKIKENVSKNDKCDSSELLEDVISNTDCVEEKCEEVDWSLCQLFRENESNIDYVDEKYMKENEEVAYIPCQFIKEAETNIKDYVKETGVLMWKYRHKFREKG